MDRLNTNDPKMNPEILKMKEKLMSKKYNLNMLEQILCKDMKKTREKIEAL